MLKDCDNLFRENSGLIQENHGLMRENSGLIQENSGLIQENHGLTRENHGLIEKNYGIQNGNRAFEEKGLLFQIVEKAVIEKKITSKVGKNICKVVEIFEWDQILGRKEIKDELKFGDYKAGKIIDAMQMLNIIEPVRGKGKGKYIFKMQ